MVVFMVIHLSFMHVASTDRTQPYRVGMIPRGEYDKCLATFRCRSNRAVTPLSRRGLPVWQTLRYLASNRETQSETASPLLMSDCTRPSTMNVGDV